MRVPCSFPPLLGSTSPLSGIRSGGVNVRYSVAHSYSRSLIASLFGSSFGLNDEVRTETMWVHLHIVEPGRLLWFPIVVSRGVPWDQ
jgi:hypothetical protein